MAGPTRYQPTDATTNPSLIYKAAMLPQFQHLVDDAITSAMEEPRGDYVVDDRARSHCRFVLSLIHFIPDSLTYSVPLFLNRPCDRALGGRGRADGADHRQRAAPRAPPRPPPPPAPPDFQERSDLLC
jgi:hypothetical protein